MKRLTVGLLCAGTLLWAVSGASAAGIAGIELGAMVPTKSLDDAVDTGGVMSPYVGYMFTDYVGFVSHLQIWAGKSKDQGPTSDDNTTWMLGGMVGPRLALPLGPVELWGTAQAGVFTALADEALTGTSWGFSPGGGVNVAIAQGWSVGGFGRWNWLGQKVHRAGDAKYVTTGLTIGYKWGTKEPPLPPVQLPPPPAPVAAAPPPPPPPPPVTVKKIVLRGVNFDFDKDAIRADARPVLDEAIRILKEEGGIAVIAEGHTDAVGSDEYNMKLSMRRAEAVRGYVVDGGIAAERIKLEGYGESKPVATNDTEEGRAQNRRVELRVLED